MISAPGISSGVRVRPMTPGDIDEAIFMSGLALAENREERERAMHRSAGELAGRRGRYLHVLATDAPGAWVAEDDGGSIVGVALALRRRGIWILSLLAVEESLQGRGVGRALMGRALAYAEGCRARMTVSSTHPAAIRSYALAGMGLEPTLFARGVPVRRPSLLPGVREGTPADLPLAEDVDLRVRGAAHGEDIPVMMEMDGGLRFLVYDGPDGRGYALERAGTTWLLAATEERIAAGLLRTCLAGAAGEVEVAWISARQGWAVPVALEAGLRLEPAGCVCVGGEVGPLAPYLPSGPFL